jgi:hypothetical protein
MLRHLRVRCPGIIGMPPRCAPGLSRDFPRSPRHADGHRPGIPAEARRLARNAGGRGAVGWQRRSSDVDEPVREEPVEFDCLHGCTLTAAHLRVFAASHRQLH